MTDHEEYERILGRLGKLRELLDNISWKCTESDLACSILAEELMAVVTALDIKGVGFLNVEDPHLTATAYDPNDPRSTPTDPTTTFDHLTAIDATALSRKVAADLRAHTNRHKKRHKRP